ncbi:MAG: hypothetical protein AAF610_12230 [Pseudomonadota bacterium]
MKQSVISAWRQFGLIDGALYLIDQALARVSDRTRLQCYTLTVQPIVDTPLAPRRFLRAWTYRELHAGAQEFEHLPVPTEVISDRFEQGARCLAAFRDNELTGFMWFVAHCYHEDEVRCDYFVHPPAAAVFDFDFYILPEHRQGLGFVALWDGANRFLYELGIRQSFSRITKFNSASRKAHEHLGMRDLGSAAFLKLWRFECMVATVAPYISVSWTRERRVRLDLGM